MSPLDATADKNLRLALVDEVYCNKHGYDWLAEVSELRDRYETTRHAEREPAWSDSALSLRTRQRSRHSCSGSR